MAVYSWTKEAPARIFSQASLPSWTPPIHLVKRYKFSYICWYATGCSLPAPMIGREPLVSLNISLTTWSWKSLYLELVYLLLFQSKCQSAHLCAFLSEWSPTQPPCLLLRSSNKSLPWYCGVGNNQTVYPGFRGGDHLHRMSRFQYLQTRWSATSAISSISARIRSGAILINKGICFSKESLACKLAIWSPCPKYHTIVTLPLKLNVVELQVLL